MPYDYRSDEDYRLHLIGELLSEYCRRAHGEELGQDDPDADVIDFMRDFRQWLLRENLDLGAILRDANTLTQEWPESRPSDVIRCVDTGFQRAQHAFKRQRDDRLHGELVNKVLDRKQHKDVQEAIARDDHGESRRRRRRRRKTQRPESQPAQHSDNPMHAALERRKRLAAASQ